MATPLDSFRTMVSKSGTFQTLVGASGTTPEKEAAALARVVRFGAEPRPAVPRMYIRLESGRRVRASTSDYRCEGVVVWKLEAGKPSGASDLDAELAGITETAWDLVADLTALSVSTGLLEFAEVEFEAPRRSGKRDDEEFWVVVGRARFPA